MLSMLKRLPLVLILGLAACSSQNGSSDPTTQVVTVTSTAAPTSSTSAESTQPTQPSTDTCAAAAQFGPVDQCDGKWAVVEGIPGIFLLYLNEGGAWREYPQSEYCTKEGFERVPKQFVPKLGNCPFNSF